MDKYEQDKHDIIDEDLVEEFDDEEMYELVMQAQREAIERAELEKKNPDPKPKRPFPKWPFWLIAIALAFNIVAALPQTLSIPAINFLVKSATLDRKSTRLNSSHVAISYAVFCLQKKRISARYVL